MPKCRVAPAPTIPWDGRGYMHTSTHLGPSVALSRQRRP